jgi:hypothetical protein
MAFVYQHRRLDTNEIFYIGIGKNKKRLNSYKNRNSHWLSIAKKYGFQVDLLIDGCSWNDACEVESGLIDAIGRKDLNLGPLVNMTNGGEGLNNPSYETVKKLKDCMTGKTLSSSTKDKLSIAMKNKKPINRQAIDQFDLFGTYICSWTSIYEAHLATNIAKSSISKCCKGKLSRAGKYTWRYKK